LLPARVDVDWLADTTSVVGAADTYLHIRRTLHWDDDTYEHWLLTTSRRLLGAAAGSGAPGRAASGQVSR
jgi:hypothetical protein